MGLIDNINKTFNSIIEWIKNAIKKFWSTFKLYMAKVATWAGVMITAIRNLIDLLKEKMPDVFERLKNGKLKLFIHKSTDDPFRNIIQDAKKDGKISTYTVSMDELRQNNTTNNELINLVATNENLDTVNVATVKAEMIDRELREILTEEVTQLNYRL